MREGINIVVIIMIVLIIAFAVVFIFSERLLGTDKNVLQPSEKETEYTIATTICKASHGTKSFSAIGGDDGCSDSDCPQESESVSSDSDCTVAATSGDTKPDVCCCKCK